MSRTVRGDSGAGSEWWGKRPLAGTSKGNDWTWWWKRRLHKIERKNGSAEGRQSDD